MIHFIIGYNNEKFQQNIIDNLKRLSAESFIVVQNGANWGKIANETVLNSEPGVCNFLNTALEYLKENHPNDWFVRLDIDDYYGKFYKDDIYKAINDGYDFSGILDIFVKTENNKLYYCKQNAPFGGTLAGSIKDAAYFHSDKAYGEDSTWYHDMIKNNKFFNRLSKSYGYIRHNDHKHVFPMSGDSIAQISREAHLIGPWDEKIVNFEKEFETKPLNLNPADLFDNIRKKFFV